MTKNLKAQALELYLYGEGIDRDTIQEILDEYQGEDEFYCHGMNLLILDDEEAEQRARNYIRETIRNNPELGPFLVPSETFVLNSVKEHGRGFILAEDTEEHGFYVNHGGEEGRINGGVQIFIYSV